MKEILKYNKYLVVLGAFLLQLTIGNIYTYNNISLNLKNYMQNRSLNGENVNRYNLVWILCTAVFGLGSSVSLGGLMLEKWSPSFIVLIGGWFMSINIMLMRVTISTHLSIVIISYGLFCGIGAGIVYGVSIGVACEWFPNKRGLVTGIVVSGFGFSSCIFDIIENQYVYGDVMDKLPNSFIVIGSICFIIQFIGANLLFRPSKNQKYVNLNESGSVVPVELNSNKNDEVKVKPHELFWEFDFWLLWITFALLSSCLTLMVSVTQTISRCLGIKENSDDLFISRTSVVGSICNGFGRIFWGWCIDRFRYKPVMLVLAVSQSLFFGTFYLAEIIPQSGKVENNPGTLAFYFIWIIFLYFISSGAFSIFPAVCAKIFGAEHFVPNYGMLITAFSVAGLANGLILNVAQQKSHMAVCISGTLLSLIAALITLVYRGKSLIHRKFLYE